METTKNSDIRVYNRKRIVNMLFRQGQMTKQELSQKLDISLPTVNLLLKELTDKGLVTKGKVLNSTGGRKPVCNMPVYGARYSIGAEASEKYLRIVLMDLGGNVIQKTSHPMTRACTKEYWTNVNDIIMDFARTHVKDMSKLLDIGMTLNVPMQDGHIVWKEGTSDEDIQVDFDPYSCFEMPVKFRNSTKMAAIAQMWAGHEQGCFAFVSLGEAIRGALVHDNNVMDFSNVNGEFGEMYMNSNRGPLKISEYFSTNRLCERSGDVNVAEFFENLQAGNPNNETIWKEYVDDLGVFLYNLYCIFGWRIIIGGSLSGYIKPYEKILAQRIRELYDICELSSSCLSISSFEEYGAAVGAASLPVDEFLEFGYDKV